MDRSTALPDDVIVEFTKQGNVVRVTAFDAATLVEACIVGPASAGEAALERAALRKLAYVLRRRNARASASSP